MTNEPTVLMTIFDIIVKIVVYVGIVGGFIFFLCLINSLLEWGKKVKCRKHPFVPLS